MNFLKKMKGTLSYMPKMLRASRFKSRTANPVLGKRKLGPLDSLDYYSDTVFPMSRPPLASPKLEEDSKIKQNVHTKYWLSEN